MSSRELRARRRAASKRNVLGAIDENTAVHDTEVVSSTKTDGDAESNRLNTIDINHSWKKQAVLSSWNDLDGTKESEVRSMISDLEELVQSFKTQNTTELDAACFQMDKNLTRVLLKLPKALRNMSGKQFQEHYGTNVVTMFQEKMEAASAGGAGYNKRNLSDVDEDGPYERVDGRSLRTPARMNSTSSNTLRTPATVRAVRKNETVYSANGSPVDHTRPVDQGNVVVSLKKLRTNAGKQQCVASATYNVQVGEDQYVDLKNPRDIDNLDAEAKRAAYRHLQELHEETVGLMSKFMDWSKA